MPNPNSLAKVADLTGSVLRYNFYPRSSLAKLIKFFLLFSPVESIDSFQGCTPSSVSL
jgi:hypothetical protein